MKKKIKILILGGTGFIGYHLTAKCLKLKWNVTSVSKHIPKKKYFKKAKYIKINLKKIKELKTLKKDYDYIVNASGYIDNNSTNKYNNDHFKILRNLVLYFKKSSCKKFLNIGTSSEYGGSKSPQKEKFKCFPKSSYGRDKLKCTNYLLSSHRSFKFPSIIFRVYQAYGPFQELNRLIPIAANAFYFNRKFDCSDGKQLRDFIYIEDLISAVIKALKSKNAVGNIFNIGSGKTVSIKFIINSIRNYFKRGKPIFGSIPLRKDETYETYPDISKTKNMLRWRPKVSFKKGLLKTLSHYKKEYLNKY